MHKKIAILCFGAFILAVASVIFVQRGYFEKQSYLSGDEPHYIMLADNLTHYGDFDIKRTFQDHRWSLYYTGTVLEPHVSPVFNKDSSHWYSIHTVGLPLLLAAPYAVGGVIGARIFIMLVQLSLIPLFYLLLRRFIASPKRRMLALGLLAFNPLYWQNVGAIMPDMVVVVLAVLALLLFWRKDIWSNIALIMIVVLAYLVHTKGLLLVGPIVLAKYAADIATVGNVVDQSCTP